MQALRSVRDPEIGENIVDLNMVKGIELSADGSSVKIRVALTVPECPLTSKIRSEVSEILSSQGVKSVVVDFTSMDDSERGALVERVRSLRSERLGRRVAADKSEAASKTQANVSTSQISRLDKGRIHNILAVASGKGGVGKSTVAALLAIELRKHGFRVGILDADITGPSIPRLLGLRERLTNDGKKLLPASTKKGLNVVSMNLIVENETDATIWRGPIVNGVIRQLFSEVEWGELDYLIVDLPPGTSDAPLTVFQSIPLDGIIVVSSPQELARVIVAKAVNMAKKLKVPVLGLVENMTYITCSHCGSKTYVFGKVDGDQAAKDFGVPYLGEMPLDPSLAGAADAGKLEDYDSKEMGVVLKKLGRARVSELGLNIIAASQ